MNSIFHKDFLEFLQCLRNAQVRYILVGGYSVVIHGYPRTTGDLDIWVERTAENYEKLQVAFEEFQLPLFEMSMSNFLNVSVFDVFRFGRPPLAIDIITELKGLSFETAWSNVQRHHFEGVEVNYLHLQDLLKAKKAAGRPKDINDLENLPPTE